VTFVPAIQAFIPVESGINTFEAPVDFSRGWIFPGGATSDVLTRFGITSGVEELSEPLSSYDANAGYPPFQSDITGAIAIAKALPFNSNGVVTIDASTLAFIADWGTQTGLGPDYPNCVGVISDPVPLWTGEGIGLQSFMLAGVYRSAFSQNVAVVSINPVLQFAGFLMTLDEAEVTCVAGPSSVAEATGYVIGSPGLIGGPYQLGIYQVTIGIDAQSWNPTDWPTPNGSIAGAPIGSKIMPTDIDPTATTLGCTGAVLDQTDGNILANITTDGTNSNYVVKISAVTGQLLWKLVIPSGSGSMMKYSSIRHGVFCHLLGSAFTHTLYTIDTIAGTLTSSTNNNLAGIVSGDQCYNDSTGALILHAQVTNAGTAGHPLRLNDTPATFTAWAALYVNAAFSQPVIPYSRTSQTRIWGNYP
jgi:hypothetical protein